MTTFETIVIGKGLFGAAAARYLSRDGTGVALIGPDEPADPAHHDGVFASHYDEGRLTRQIGQDAVWAALAIRAVSRYGEIEELSGVRFHSPVGNLVVDTPDGFHSYRHDPLQTAAQFQIPHTCYPPGDRRWRDQFPDLYFPAHYQVLHEPGPAGMINPRRLVQAQTEIARRQGAMIVPEMVTAVEEATGAVIVHTAGGGRHPAERVLVAAGAFSNFNRLLPTPLPLKLKTETIILAEVDPDEAGRLANLPVIIYQVDDPEIDDIYMTPPLRYPDGRFYVKLGCNTIADTWPETMAEVQHWFRAGDGERCRPAMARALQAICPAVSFRSIRTHRCIICYTPSGYPIIDRLSDRLFVAIGGNGSGAKGSDTVGWLAALTVRESPWPEPFDPATFRLARSQTG